MAIYASGFGRIDRTLNFAASWVAATFAVSIDTCPRTTDSVYLSEMVGRKLVSIKSGRMSDDCRDECR